MINGSENVFQFGAAFAQALVNGLLAGIAVALVVYAFVRLHRGLNAATRHAAWYAALVVIAAMPAVSFAVSLARIHVSSTVTTYAPAPAHLEVPSRSAPAAAPNPSVTGQRTAPSLAALPLQPVVFDRIAVGVAIVLAAIAAARIGLLFAGLLGLARVKRASRIVDPSFVPSLARAMVRDRDARFVHVRVSETLDAPAAAGFRTPAILLPVDLVESLEADALDQIAMHEYAHLRRYDDWTNLAQRFIERLYWFNPAIWFVCGRIDLEREIACDDWAVAGADGVSRYADCLWRLANDGRMPAFAATAPGAFLTRSQIGARIEHLLQRHRDGTPTLRTTKLLAIAPVLAAALALVIGRAPAIAIHVSPPVVAQHHAHPVVSVHMVAIHSTGAVAPKPTCTRPPQAYQSRAVSRVTAATIDKAVQTAMLAHRAEIAAAVSAAMATQHAAIRASMHQAIHANRHRIEQMVHEKFPAMVAVASETDNLSYGPVDRNLLAHCTGCDLSGKNLRNADLHGLTLTGDDLTGADLRGANLRNAVLTGVDLTDAKLDGADLRDAVFTGSSIDGATFSGAKTEGIRLVGMQLTNSILAATSARQILSSCAGCDLSGLDLRGRDLHGITLDGADLHGTDLSGANLEGARFNGVDLAGVNFNGTNLKNAAFNGCDLRDVDFTHAHTQGLLLQGSTIGSN